MNIYVKGIQAYCIYRGVYTHILFSGYRGTADDHVWLGDK